MAGGARGPWRKANATGDSPGSSALRGRPAGVRSSLLPSWRKALGAWHCTQSLCRGSGDTLTARRLARWAWRAGGRRRSTPVRGGRKSCAAARGGRGVDLGGRPGREWPAESALECIFQTPMGPGRRAGSPGPRCGRRRTCRGSGGNRRQAAPPCCERGRERCGRRWPSGGWPANRQTCGHDKTGRHHAAARNRLSVSRIGFVGAAGKVLHDAVEVRRRAWMSSVSEPPWQLRQCTEACVESDQAEWMAVISWHEAQVFWGRRNGSTPCRPRRRHQQDSGQNNTNLSHEISRCPPSSELAPFPVGLDVVGNPVGQRHDGQHRVEAAVGDVHAAVGDEEVVDRRGPGRSWSTTEVFGSLPMRQVPAWCWPPLSAQAGGFARSSPRRPP